MILRVIKKAINNFSFSQKGTFFTSLMNLRTFITKSDATFKYNNIENYYIVSSKAPSEKRKLIFKHELIGGPAYLKGIHQRGEAIGERYLLNKINFLDGDIVFDCGANLGDLLLWFQNRNLKISYTAFEPSPQEYRCLVDNIGNQDAKQVALWNEAKSLDFFISSQTADSSIIEPSNYDNILKVPAIRLDSILENNIKLLKLEAEGGELEVLEGAGKKLNKIQYIAADLGPERGIKKESTLIPVTDFLKLNNFTLVEFNSKHVTALFKNNNLPF